MSLPWDLPSLQPAAHISYRSSDFTELFIDISLGIGPQLTLHGETNSDPKVRTGKLGRGELRVRSFKQRDLWLKRNLQGRPSCKPMKS